MQLNLEEITQKLLTTPYFEKAKQVKEIGPGHPEDSVYAHLVQTAHFIKVHKDGDFLSNPEAKALFQAFMNKKVEDVSYSDIAIVAGLLHDIGKILFYKEEEKVLPINQMKPDKSFSYSPNHAYYGSIVANSLLQELHIDEKIVTYITNIVRLHMVFFDYYNRTAGYSLTDAMNDLKPMMEGLHVEVALNAYAETETNPPLVECRELIRNMLDEPHFYSKREYFID